MSNIIKELEKVENHMISQGDYFDHSLIVRRAIEEIESRRDAIEVLRERLIATREQRDAGLWTE